MQCRMGLRKPLALEQIRDQPTHLAEVVQQRVALWRCPRRLGQQLGVQARAGERAAQLVADRQQQPALGIEHAADVLPHRVERARDLAELVGAAGIGHRDRAVELARAEALRAGADRIERTQLPPHVQVGQQGQHQQDAERGDEHARAALEQRRVQAEDEPMAIGRDAGAQRGHLAIGVTGALTVMFAVTVRPRRVRRPPERRPLDAQRDRQPGRQRLCPDQVGHAPGRDLGGEPVDVVGHQRACGFTPAHAEGEAPRRHERDRQPQRQQQKPQHQPYPQRGCKRGTQAARGPSRARPRGWGIAHRRAGGSANA
jgi:hypothetical protein